jgi:outer membrane receptor protein involved in Fe transport
VTASRLQASGFDAPTPLTSLSADDVALRGLPNVADFLNEVPSFVASSTPASNSYSTSTLGLNTLDLRGLGSNRTLVLVDGRRRVSTTDNGAVDINTVPMALIERVEVVTGGASAAWGSDAIAGVVNILLNDKFEGLRTSVQYGSSTRGDAQSTHVSAAFGGTLGDNQGHLVVAAEYQTNSGLDSQRDRKLGREGWALVPNPEDTGPNDGIPARRIVRNAGYLLASPGGLILGPDPIAFTQFDAAGTAVPYDFCDFTAGTWTVNGDGGLVDSQLIPDSDRNNLMALYSRDLSDSVQLFFQGSFAESRGSSNIVPPFGFPITIQADNAYLPAAFKSTLDSNGITSFDLYRLNSDFGFVRTTQQVQTTTATTGLKGTFGSTWNWEIYGQYGRTRNQLSQRNLMVQNQNYATDAVISPDTGEIVCRATLTGGAPGCVPLNVFGFGAPSAAAIDYVMGESFSNQKNTQRVVAANMHGTLFEGWAGPIAAAFGIEYREDEIAREVDEHSRASDFLISNYQPLFGTINVKEIFAETGVPLLSEMPFAYSLDLNAAVRLTDYSTSGSVTTWKVGATYAPVKSIKLRGTLSRDIRSPNAAELFTASSLAFFQANDPFTNTSPFFRVLTTGNPNLSEEVADTTTVGVVIEPDSIPGLRASVDWYDIELKDRVGILGLQEIIDLCFEGNAELCQLISRDADGQIVEITDPQLNIGKSHFAGVDFELQYRQSLERIGGAMSYKVLASYVDKMEYSLDGVTTTDNVGSLGTYTTSIIPGAPKWRWNASATYASGPASVTASLRYIGSGHYDANYTAEDLSAEDNSIGSVTYVDLAARYDLARGGSETQLFIGINNLMDKQAPPLPIDFFSQRPINTILYDAIGRYVYGGIRFNF